jgi:hypothetical protein
MAEDTSALQQGDLPGGYWSVAPAPPAGTFDIGLVMAGAVSAGAFSAGALDFLIEALDAFEADKQAERKRHGPDPRTWSIPGHMVRIRVMAGASAGSIASAIAAVALKYRFPHVSSDTVKPERNPFYRAWVSRIDIGRMLETRDLDDPAAPLTSLLDSTSLTEIADEVFNYRAEAAPPRPYLHSPVRYLFALNNVRGIPYFVQMIGAQKSQGFAMIGHGDYASFDVRYRDGAGAPARADDVRMAFPNSATGWKCFATAALGSGAFPAFLAPRWYQPDAANFKYRFLLGPGGMKGALRAVEIKPSWNGGVTPDPYTSAVIDGGTLNNEPLARTELAGIAGENPRSGRLANRATILIDPFPDLAAHTDDPRRGQRTDVFGSLMGLLSGWISQARFSASDLALADNGEVYSRYLLAPDRGEADPGGATALACGALGGFSGFLSEQYRRHDYLLGRRNCQHFLRRYFVVPLDNEHVTAAINPALLAEGQPWIVKGDDGRLELQLIPLLGRLATPEPQPAWPIDQFAPDSIAAGIKRRVNAVAYALARSKIKSTFYQIVFYLLWGACGWMVRRELARKVVAAVTRELKKHKLLSS